MQAAFDTLDTYDAAFGPAEDGGYYLLGLKGPELPQGIFENVEWSTAEVLKQNANNIEKAKLRLAPLNTLIKLRDIDMIEDLIEWYKAAEGTERVEIHELIDIGRAAMEQATIALKL